MVSHPPSTGPSPAAVPITAPQAANALARVSPWNVVEMMASAVGSISDAPRPSMIASPSTRLATFHDSAASSDPIPKRAAPTMKTRRCPYTSPRRPPMIRNVANVRA